MEPADTLDTPADTLPQRQRAHPLYAVVYNTQDGLKLEECAGKRSTGEFIDSIGGSANVVRVYKVSEVVEIRTKTVL